MRTYAAARSLAEDAVEDDLTVIRSWTTPDVEPAAGATIRYTFHAPDLPKRCSLRKVPFALAAEGIR